MYKLRITIASALMAMVVAAPVAAACPLDRILLLARRARRHDYRQVRPLNVRQILATGQAIRRTTGICRDVTPSAEFEAGSFSRSQMNSDDPPWLDTSRNRVRMQ